MKIITILILGLLLASCSSIIRTLDGAESVRLFFPGQAGNNRHIQALDASCEFVGEVIGSEGHWYSNLFVSNPMIVQGAINDLKNKAYANGGNLVIVDGDFDFATSVTLFGQAYKCSPAEKNDKARF
jgi:hypothetical protein